MSLPDRESAAVPTKSPRASTIPRWSCRGIDQERLNSLIVFAISIASTRVTQNVSDADARRFGNGPDRPVHRTTARRPLLAIDDQNGFRRMTCVWATARPENTEHEQQHDQVQTCAIRRVRARSVQQTPKKFQHKVSRIELRTWLAFRVVPACDYTLLFDARRLAGEITQCTAWRDDVARRLTEIAPSAGL